MNCSNLFINRAAEPLKGSYTQITIRSAEVQKQSLNRKWVEPRVSLFKIECTHNSSY